MSLEYFVSSLPSLQFGVAPLLSAEQFLSAARSNLSDAAFAQVSTCISGGSGPGFAKTWHDVETQLRNAIAKARAARLSGSPDPARWLRPHGGWIVRVEQGVATAFQEKDPMARHLALCRLRWELAGEVAGTDAFSVASVCAYAVRLRICSDLAKHDSKKGAARLRAAAGVLEK